MRPTPVRILLIEDEPSQARLIKEFLALEWEGAFEFLWADRLTEGLQKARGGIDVILLDLSLPDSMGFESFARARAALPRVPIVVFSGAADKTLALRTVQEGAQDYLLKGEVSGTLLVRSIRYAVERHRAEQALQAEITKHAEELERRVDERTLALQTEITVRKRTEERLVSALRRLEAQNLARSDFISNVSHELRTPLTSMSYEIQNLLDGTLGPIPETAANYLKMLDQDCQRMTKTVEDILDLSRLEAGTLRLHNGRVPFSRLVARSARLIRPLAEKRRIETVLKLPPDLGFVSCDTLKMERVLLNIIGNAVKFTPEGGRMEIVLHAENSPFGFLFLDVIDNGIGIGAEHLNRVTEKYYRAGEQVPGAGLGLAIAKEIVDLHGGRLSIQSPPPNRQKGTAVSVVLPATDPPVILVSGDEPAAVRLLLSYGYRVAVCSGICETLDAIQTAQPDVLVTNLDTPLHDTEELILILKSREQHRSIPILVLSERGLPGTKRAILDGFAIPLLFRPWQDDDFLDRLDQALSGEVVVRRMEHLRTKGAERHE